MIQNHAIIRAGFDAAQQALYHVAVDVGSTTTKARGMTVTQQQIGMPIYGDPVAVEFTTLGVLSDAPAFTSNELHSIVTEDTAALIGRKTASFGAQPYLAGDWYDDPLYMLYLLTGIGATLTALHAPEQATIACLTIGFPAEHVSRGQQIAELLTKEPLTFTVDGVRRVVTIARCEYVSQPQAVIASQVCHRQGTRYVSDLAFAQQHVMVYDKGGRTGNRAVLSGSLVKLDGHGCEQDGIMHYLGAFKTGIFQRLGVNVDDAATLLQAWAEQSIWHNGQDHDLRDLVETIASGIVERDVAPTIRNALAKMKVRPDRLLLAGGGVIHLADWMIASLRNEFRNGIGLTTGDNGEPNPRTAVIEGMLKWSVMQHEKSLREKKA